MGMSRAEDCLLLADMLLDISGQLIESLNKLL